MIKSYVNELVANSLKKSNIPKYWIEYMREPVSSVTVKFPIQRSSGIETIIGTRVIHSNHHLPTKGGLRFSDQMDIENLGSLAAIMSYKSAILGIPFGGAKGCIFINPNEYSEEEKNHIVRRFTTEMWKRSLISSSVDVYGPDLGTNSRTMNIIRDQYKLLLDTNSVDIDNVVVGKSLHFGGLEAYDSSHGLGVAAAINYLVRNVNDCKKVHQFTGSEPSRYIQSVIIHGFDKTGFNTANELAKSGKFKVIGITHGNEAIYNPIGFKPEDVRNYLKQNGTLNGYTKQNLTAEEVVTRRCDIAVITTKEFSVGKDLANKLECRFLVEGSNIPLNQEAYEAVLNKKIILIPDLLASCGSQVCGYIEWLKNMEHRNLTMLFKRFEKKVRQDFIKLVISSDSFSKKENYTGPTENDLVVSCIEEMVFNSIDETLTEAIKNDLDLKSAAYKIALEKMYAYYEEKKII